MAHRYHNCMDGQYGGAVLDQKSGKIFEGFRNKSSEQIAEITQET